MGGGRRPDFIFCSLDCSNFQWVGGWWWLVAESFIKGQLYNASTKILERKGSISPFSFYGQPPNFWSQVFSLAYPMDEFSFKEMRMWDQSKFTSYCIFVCCESGELGGRRSSRFPCVIPVVETSSDKSWQTLTTELLWDNSQRPKHVDCFFKKAPSQAFDWVSNADPTRGAANVGCG